MGAQKYRNGFSVTTHASTLDEPLKWARPRLVFVNSMSDLFHKSVPPEFIEAVFDVMNRLPQRLIKMPLQAEVQVWSDGVVKRIMSATRIVQDFKIFILFL